LAFAGAAHALHDGYTDLIYILLPIWQSEFALGYGMLGVLRALYAGAMAALQVPAGRLAERWDGRWVLALGTLTAALGYALAGYSGGLVGLGVALAISGAGSSTQHPIASAAVSRAYGRAARGPLGTYNFSGDLGKASIPALTSLLLTLMPWRQALWVLVALGVLSAVAIFLFMPPLARRRPQTDAVRVAAGAGRGGFPLLFSIGVLDTAVRMGLLTFLPFLLKTKGAALPTIGFALTLIFLGGAAGKFTCGWLGARVGIVWTVLLTETGTAVGGIARRAARPWGDAERYVLRAVWHRARTGSRGAHRTCVRRVLHRYHWVGSLVARVVRIAWGRTRTTGGNGGDGGNRSRHSTSGYHALALLASGRDVGAPRMVVGAVNPRHCRGSSHRNTGR
jgi:MFS family permease